MSAPIAISTPEAPTAIGPYSQAIRAGAFVYCSGQLGLDPVTGELVSGGTGEETRQALHNVERILRAADLSLGDVAKTTVYLRSMDDFAEMNEAYAAAFGPHRPARATIEVGRLPKDAAVEVEAVAHDGSP